MSAQSLPASDSYADIFDEIDDLRRRRNAIILAHYYQEPDIQDLADYIGDSLQLAKAARDTDADVILFCGVHFMAETAKILNPERVVLIPDMKAGCSLADAAPAKRVARWKADHPGAVLVSYVNCTAGVKALSDIICTSSNAVQVVESLGAGHKQEAEVIAQRVDRGRIGGQEVPVFDVVHALPGRELSHALRRIDLPVEADCHDREGIVPQCFPSNLDIPGEVLRNHRADMVAARVDHADDERPPPEFLQLERLPEDIPQSIVQQASTDGRLADRQRRVFVVFLGSARQRHEHEACSEQATHHRSGQEQSIQDRGQHQ